jgi:hypothetical protein
MTLTLFNPTFWLLLIPMVLLALAGMFPAQHFIHIFQLESYKRPQFFMRLKEDDSFQRGLEKFKNIVWFIELGALLLLVALSIAVRTLPVALIASAAVVLICYAAYLLWFFRWKRQPSKKPLKITSRVVRLEIALALVLIVAQAVVYVLVMAVVLAIRSPIVLAGSPCIGTSVLTLAVFLIVVTLADFSFYFLPRLLAFASILVQPIENAIQRKQTNASGDEMV